MLWEKWYQLGVPLLLASHTANFSCNESCHAYGYIVILYLQLCRFEATRQIRSVESEVNEKIASGEVSREIFGNVVHWHTPILAMTADVIQATHEECMKCGMDDYVSKPFEEGQLYSTVARFFESS